MSLSVNVKGRIKMDDKLKDYPKSKDGNFYVKDTIGVPHTYCITPKHFYGDGMFMDAERIKLAEKENNAVCDICKHAVRQGKQDKILSYDEHQQALLIACKLEANKNKELHEYLLSIKDRVIKDGFAGFAFMKVKNEI